MNRQTFQWYVPAAALAVLALMEGWKLTLPSAAAGAPFLAGVREEFKDFPKVVGDWDGTDVALPQEAIALLHPNLCISRRYNNAKTGQTVQLLLIEAEDSRDMMGHYPPNCYPGNGWELKSQQGATWGVGGLAIPGVEYVFTRQSEGRDTQLTVRDFFILPNGHFYPDIASFGRAASDFYIRPFGATQVQVVFDRDYLPADRERIFQSLLTAHLPLIHAVLNGKKD